MSDPFKFSGAVARTVVAVEAGRNCSDEMIVRVALGNTSGQSTIICLSLEAADALRQQLFDAVTGRLSA